MLGAVGGRWRGVAGLTLSNRLTVVVVVVGVGALRLTLLTRGDEHFVRKISTYFWYDCMKGEQEECL